MFFKKLALPFINAVFKVHRKRLDLTEKEYQQAMALYNQGKTREAQKIFQQIVEQNPSDKTSRLMSGKLANELKNEEKTQPNANSNTPKRGLK